MAFYRVWKHRIETRLAFARRLVALVALIILSASPLLIAPRAALAQDAPAAAPAPAKVDQLLQLLEDPDVKAWMASRQAPAASPEAAAPPLSVATLLDRAKAHLDAMATAVPLLPMQFARAWTILELEFEEEGVAGIVALIFVFLAAGFGLDWVVRRLAKPYLKWMVALPYATPQGRVKNLGARIVYAVMRIGAFVVGTAGVFLIFNWPPLLREIVLGYLSVAIVTRATLMLVRSFLMPPSLGLAHSSDIRVFPMTDARAEHWYRWIGINVFWLGFVLVTFQLMATFGFSDAALFALSIPTSFIQLVLLLLMIVRRPRIPVVDGARPAGIGHTGWTWISSTLLLLVWVIQMLGTWKLYWAVIAIIGLPAAIMLAHRGVTHLLRPPEAESGVAPIPPVVVAVVDRGIRLALIVAAAYVLAKAWGLEISTMTAGDAFTNRILRGVLNAAVIALGADLIWSIVKAVIAKRLGTLEGPATSGHGMDPQQARLKTLLPIFQNMLFATIFTMALLMVLSSVGIEIAPLIAGAGVAGVAIGFGAQTLVKDVISGVFYLLDDAFRVGEYIQSGSYKGTIESFSLRSVKLRHHRGYLFTVPFGELGAVQNMSRDWVIDKFSINVDYNTDIEKARKLIKKIGLQFLENPEYAPHIIEPLKMQGVQNFGDFGIELRLKMMTKPGEQFVIRRKAYVAIKKAFEENGITIPYPTVHVREGESPTAAAAQAMLSAKAAEVPPAAA